MLRDNHIHAMPATLPGVTVDRATKNASAAGHARILSAAARDAHTDFLATPSARIANDDDPFNARWRCRLATTGSMTGNRRHTSRQEYNGHGQTQCQDRKTRKIHQFLLDGKTSQLSAISQL